MKNETEIEDKLQSKCLNAPRLSPERIDKLIIDKQFHVFPGTATTVCCLELANGFTVIGESACVSLENFDAEIGQSIAYQNAREKIWQLEGYWLKQKLHEADAQ